MKPRVLVIDDDLAITQQLFWTLCDEYEVLVASDLRSAVRRATIYEPDVSILDLYLPPRLDSPEIGYRVLEYLKENVPSSKVLVISSAFSEETKRACVEYGADAVLDKPFEVDHLLSTIHRYAPVHTGEAA